jgi:hypothetical protein
MTGVVILSFPYAGINRIRFEGIVSTVIRNISDLSQVTPKEGL